MLDNAFYVIVFDSTHHAIRTENSLKDRFHVEMIPTPREISASCGLSIKFGVGLYEEVMEVLNSQGEDAHVFKIEKNGNQKKITKVS